MDKTGYIYILTSISGKSYIGQTVNIRGRILSHKSNARNGNNAVISKAIKKYGWDSFTLEYIIVDEKMMNSYEKMMIRTMNTFKGEGYNCTEGGEGGSDFNPSRLTGRKYGRLTCIGLSWVDDLGKTITMCKCDCGKEKQIWTGNLTSGMTASCGCLRKDNVSSLMRMKQPVSAGDNFHRLVVKEVFYKDGSEKAWAKCLCSCGVYMETRAANLTNEYTKSCGCLNRELSTSRCRIIQKKAAETTSKRISVTFPDKTCFIFKSAAQSERILNMPKNTMSYRARKKSVYKNLNVCYI